MSLRVKLLLLGFAILLIAASAAMIYLSGKVNTVGIIGKSGNSDIEVPEGFVVGTFATGLDGPRFMDRLPAGAILAAERGADRIVLLEDADSDGVAETLKVFADGLNNPHSVKYERGYVYVGIPTGVVRLTDSDDDGRADTRENVVSGIPGKGRHSTRTVEFLPSGNMILSVGSSCNSCFEDDDRRAAILEFETDSYEYLGIYAEGLRNAVGLAIDPITGALWATDNSRDLMGDDIPPDTIRRIEQGSHYGWPTCHSGSVADPKLGDTSSCELVAMPEFAIQAHSAPLGLTVYDGSSFPAEYIGDIFVAYHGSWNRSEPTGYKVVRIKMGDKEPSVEDFATGWLSEDGETALGRPVDVLVGADGALYISDDKAGVIYRIQYEGSD